MMYLLPYRAAIVAGSLGLGIALLILLWRGWGRLRLMLLPSAWIELESLYAHLAAALRRGESPEDALASNSRDGCSRWLRRYSAALRRALSGRAPLRVYLDISNPCVATVAPDEWKTMHDSRHAHRFFDELSRAESLSAPRGVLFFSQLGAILFWILAVCIPAAMGLLVLVGIPGNPGLLLWLMGAAGIPELATIRMVAAYGAAVFLALGLALLAYLPVLFSRWRAAWRSTAVSRYLYAASLARNGGLDQESARAFAARCAGSAATPATPSGSDSGAAADETSWRLARGVAHDPGRAAMRNLSMVIGMGIPVAMVLMLLATSLIFALLGGTRFP